MRLTKSIWFHICCACSSTQGIFNVRCYGAKGDGQTDDIGAILAARNAVNAAGGGVLFFPPGSFVVSDTIELGANTTVLGAGAGSVLLAKPGVAGFTMLFVRSSDDVRVRDLVLDGNRDMTSPPTVDNENIGCGFLGQPDKGQTGLSIRNVIVRDHHRSGIRITGPHNCDDPYRLCPNEVELIGCQIRGCGGRGIFLTRATRARVAGNVVTRCTGAGIQVVKSRAAVIDGNVIERTVQSPQTTGGHGIAAANSFDYVIVNNAASENERWGIVASGGVGLWPPDGHPMSMRYVVANNVCRGNAAGGITIDPTLPKDHQDHDLIHDNHATVAANVCAANHGPGIRASHAGYLTIAGNVCDGNRDDADEYPGIGIISCRHVTVADNVLTGNTTYGLAFRAPVEGAGYHLLGGNVYDGNGEGEEGEIYIDPDHPGVRQLQDRWPDGGLGGMNLPVSSGDPANPVDGLLYVNTEASELRVYAEGAWRTLASW